MHIQSMKKIIAVNLFIFFLIIGSNSFAQQSPVLGNFYLFESNAKIYLNWSIVSGSTCNGIKIFRSIDSTNFYEIGKIEGICGNIYSEQFYNFIDDNPVKNKCNFYKLELGNSGSSEIISIEIIGIEKNGFQLRPNPIVRNAKLYFDNVGHEQNKLVVFKNDGTIVFELTTRESFFDISGQNLSSALYLFYISAINNSIKVKGEFLVSH